MIKSLLTVGLGGGIGAMLRFLITSAWKTNSFPFHTLFINIIGCLLIGIVLALSQKTNFLTNDAQLFLATGICGGFTTFSTFSAENFQLIRSGEYAMAAIYIFTSVAVCIVATFVGFKIINN
jgi:CrcB protein